MARRPCVYCTVLIIALFAASCNFDLSTASSSGAGLARCWCDFNDGKILSPRLLWSPQNISMALLNSTSAVDANYTAAVPAKIIPFYGNKMINAVHANLDSLSTSILQPYLGFRLQL